MTAEKIELVRALQSTLCACGAAKKAGLSFCGDCYSRLPEPQRQALWRRLGKGYEEAHAAAMETLGALTPGT